MNIFNKSSASLRAFYQAIPWDNPDVPISVRLYSSDKLTSASTYYHYHKTVIEIHIIRQGGRSFFVDHRLFPFKGYTAIVIRPGQIHRRFSDGLRLREIGLMFDRRLISGRPAKAIVKTLPVRIKLSSLEINLLETHGRMLAYEADHPTETTLNIARNELENIILLLQRAAGKKQVEQFTDARIIRLIKFLDVNYNQQTNLEQLAKIAAMSPSHLISCFKKQTGQSIKQYILQSRVSIGKNILESSKDIKMVSLATELGFSDLSLFNRCFKRYVGMPPGAYHQISHKHKQIY